jgi:hypothetical protein
VGCITPGRSRGANGGADPAIGIPRGDFWKSGCGRDEGVMIGWRFWVGLVELAGSLQGACRELAGELGGEVADGEVGAPGASPNITRLSC